MKALFNRCQKISKLISVCLINDYSLIAELYIFVYSRAECASFSLECTKVNLLILNNFGHFLIHHKINQLFRHCLLIRTKGVTMRAMLRNPAE